MTFDKAEYWKRRKAGLPGQEPFNPVVRRHSVVDWQNNHKLHSKCGRSEVREVERMLKGGNYKVLPKDDPLYAQLKEAAERSIAERAKHEN